MCRLQDRVTVQIVAIPGTAISNLCGETEVVAGEHKVDSGSVAIFNYLGCFLALPAKKKYWIKE